MVRFIANAGDGPARRSSLKVIGAGLPRTATSSLQAALEELGFSPCLHMAEIIPRADRQQLLLDALHEKDKARRQKLVHQLVDGYAAVCDLPAIFFLTDLMDMYPNAQVILGRRSSAELWARSCYRSLGFFFTRRFFWIGLLWHTDRLWYRLNMSILEWCAERFGETTVFSASFYEAYNKAVVDTVEKRGRQVLDFKPEDGWQPLCEFLCRDIPSKEFPRVNEQKTFAIIRAILISRGIVCWGALGYATWVILISLYSSRLRLV